MLKWWDDWGWVAAALLIILLFVGFLYGSGAIFSRDSWCYGADDTCLRDWVSALGGWAAVAAAVPTILYLAKQVRDAERHHGTTIGIQARPTYMLAKKAAETSVNIKNEIAEKADLWKAAKLASGLEIQRQAIDRLEFLRDLVDRTEFNRIQSEIEVTYMRHEQLRDSIDSSIKKIYEGRGIISIESREFAREAVIGCSHNAMQYLDQVKDVCDRFISDFEHIMGTLK